MKTPFLGIIGILFAVFFLAQGTFAMSETKDTVYSSDSKHSADIMELANGEQAIFLNGKQYLTGSFVPYSLMFLSDNTLAFVESDSGKNRIVIGQKKGEWCDNVPSVYELRATKNWAYACLKDGKNYLYTKSGSVYGPSVSDIWITTTDGSDRFVANISPSENSLYLVTSEGTEIWADKGATIGQYVFYGKKGNKLLYTIKKDNKEQVMVDGKVGPLFDSITSLVGSTTSQSYAYYGLSGATQMLIVNGKEVARNIDATSTLYFNYYPKQYLVATFKTGNTWNVYFKNKLFTNLQSSEVYFNIMVNDAGNLWSAFATVNGVSGVYVQGKWVPRP